MDTADKSYLLEIPGDKVYELPPFCLSGKPQALWSEVNFRNAEKLVREEGLIPNTSSTVLDPGTALRQEHDLAINIAERYRRLQLLWRLGDDILRWVTHCETTFKLNATLNPFLSPDIWPHAGRTSFIHLLETKNIADALETEQAIGLRLAFRKPLPLNCLSDQFLFFLSPAVTKEAFITWTSMVPPPIHRFPPNRFDFQVFNLEEGVVGIGED
jgi:hypothetical protein